MEDVTLSVRKACYSPNSRVQRYLAVSNVYRFRNKKLQQKGADGVEHGPNMQHRQTTSRREPDQTGNRRERSVFGYSQANTSPPRTKSYCHSRTENRTPLRPCLEQLYGEKVCTTVDFLTETENIMQHHKFSVHYPVPFGGRNIGMMKIKVFLPVFIFLQINT